MDRSPAAQTRDVPDSIKREVRQRCGFGCVLCGLPLYHYHHEPPFALTGRHDPAEIFLLCAGHHDERTRGMLTAQVVLGAGADPHNLRRGVSSSHRLRFSGRECAIHLGGTRFVGSLANQRSLRPLTIDGDAPLAFSWHGEELLLSLELFDEADRRLLAIAANELVYSVEPWDVRWEGRRLSVRAGQGQYTADILFDPPNRVTVERGRLLLHGVQLLVYRDQVVVANGTPRHLTFVRGDMHLANDRVGLAIGAVPEGMRCVIHCAVPRRHAFERQLVEQWLGDA